MKLSIIVPVYNVENYLYRCIDSIKKQTLKEIEIILVDDGSTDKSGRLCDEIAKSDSRIKVVHKQNGGLSSARNEGLKYVTSEYVGFVDSDDWISEDMYEYLYNLIIKSHADVVSCSYQFAKEYTVIPCQKEYKEIEYTREDALVNYLKMGIGSTINDYSAWSKLFKKSLFDTISFPEGMLNEDIPTSFRVIQNCEKYIKSSKICYFYFQNQGSITRRKYSEKHNDLIMVSQDVVKYSEKETEEIRLLAKQQEAKAYFSLLVKVLRSDIDESIDYLYIQKTLLIPFYENYKLLMKSNMSKLKKIVAFCFKVNYKFCFSIFHRRKVNG